MKRMLFFLIVVVSLVLTQALFAESHSPEPNGSGKIERYYYVKGMTCSGCVYAVKKALQRAGIRDEQVIRVTYKEPDPEHMIGHVLLSFNESEYNGKETDCKIINEIKSNPGYTAYMDPSNTHPCN